MPDADRPRVPEAPLRRTDAGLEPAAPGWFVVNAREAAWVEREGWGRWVKFESDDDAAFAELGVNIHVIEPGQRSANYHGENGQEDFLVLHGECIAIVEGEERRLRQWDFFHAPPWTLHTFVGAGQGPCAILMMGARKDDEDVFYPVHPLAQRHGASAPRPTSSVEESYAGRPDSRPAPYRPGDLGE